MVPVTRLTAHTMAVESGMVPIPNMRARTPRGVIRRADILRVVLVAVAAEVWRVPVDR